MSDLRNIEQNFFWNLRAETGEGAENPQAAGHHHEQADGIHPVRDPNRQRMLVGGTHQLGLFLRLSFPRLVYRTGSLSRLIGDHLSFATVASHRDPTRATLAPDLAAVGARISSLFVRRSVLFCSRSFAITVLRTSCSPGLPSSRFCRLQNIGDANRVEILGLLVSEFGRHLQAQRRSVLAVERLPIHLVTQQRLRMQRRRHVNRLVIVVRALDFEKARVRVRSDQLQEIRDTRAAKRADHVPAFHADMARVLADLRQRLNLRQRVFARMLHVAFDRQRPLLQIDLRIEHVVAVVGKFLERHNFGIRKCLREMLRTKRRARGPVAETNSLLNQPVAQLRESQTLPARRSEQA